MIVGSQESNKSQANLLSIEDAASGFVLQIEMFLLSWRCVWKILLDINGKNIYCKFIQSLIKRSDEKL